MNADCLTPNPAEVFRPGTSVSIEYTDAAGINRTHNTYVHDTGPDALLLAFPTKHGIPSGIQPGQELDMRRATDLEAYRAQVTVLEVTRVAQEPLPGAQELTPGGPEVTTGLRQAVPGASGLTGGLIPLLRVSMPASVEIRPRRRFFRVDVDIPFTAGGHEGRILNMSGSGLLLTAREPFVEGSRFDVMFSLPGSGEIIRAAVRVLRAVSGRKTQCAGVLFEDLNPATQDRLVRYVFIRQRELAGQGLLVRDPRVF